jgi:dihydrofolate reductase
MDMELVAVAAVAENGVIGRGRSVPWDLPADRRLYRERVADAPVVVGRRTFESMRSAGDPPGDRQVVLSRSRDSYPDPKTRVVDGVESAMDALAGVDVGGPVYVLGGEAVYEALQPHLDRMVLSRVHRSPEGEFRYPDFDRSTWHLDRAEPHEGFTIEFWVRAE